jgi:CubicO group peptidase (beta-lactamase class C family)
LAADPLAAQSLSPTAAESLEAVVAAELRATRTPGAAVALVRGSEVVYARGFGVANVETGQQVTPEMLFRLGSTTKMFTSALVVMLAEEGKLALDAPIGRYVAGLHPQIAALTPHQLLTHTAGLTDESIMSGRHDDQALGEYARAIDGTWFFTEPDQIHSYANPGYWLAGLAAEQAAGRPYADAMAERIFRPLKMERTTLRPTLAMTWPLALGHEVRAGRPVIVRPQADNAATWPAGQIYSSATELTRFVIALLNGGQLAGEQVLSPALVASLATPAVPRPGTTGHYGYGLSVSYEQGRRIVQHGGSRQGYGSTIRLAPVERVGVIVLTNRTGSSLPKSAARAMEILLNVAWSESPEADARPLSRHEMSELAGRYSNGRQTIELSLDGNSLLARRTGRDTTPLAGSVAFAGEGRIAVLRGSADAAGEEGAARLTLTVVRGPDGKPAYLCAGSRALRRIEQ